MKQTWPATLTVLAALMCSGCVSNLLENKQPIQQTYSIAASAPAPAGTQAKPLPVSLTVKRPTVRPGLDGDRIAVLYPDRRLDYYINGRWGAAADIVVQNLLVESLRAISALQSVQSDLSGMTADYLLHTELKDFQAEYAEEASPPAAHVTLVCTVARARGRRPLATYSATAIVPAAGNNMRAVVAAFESAYRQAAESVTNATVSALATALQEAAQEETRAAAARP